MPYKEDPNCTKCRFLAVKKNGKEAKAAESGHFHGGFCRQAAQERWDLRKLRRELRNQANMC